MARLVIGVDVVGRKDVESLTQSINKADMALERWINTSSKASEDRIVKVLGVMDARFTKLQTSALAASKSLDAFLGGNYASATAKVYGHVAAVEKMEQAYRSLIATQAKQSVKEMPGVQRLLAEKKAIDANIAAYDRLRKSGELSSTYSRFSNYSGLEEQLKKDSAAIESQVAHLKDLEVEERKLQRIRNEQIVSSMEERFKQETASIQAQERGLKELELQFKKTAAARAALNQGSYAVSDYSQQGRDRLAAGSKAGGYDYTEQLKKESDLYDEVTGKMKNYPAGLSKIGKAWDDATSKGKVFHSVVRGAAGATGQLWLSYGKGAKEIAAISLAFAAVATSLRAIKEAAAFDDTTRMIQAISGESLKGAENLQLIRESVLGIKDVVSTPQELATGLLEMARAGMDAKESMADLGEISRFAALSNIDLGKAVELLVGQAKAFNDVDMGQAANIIAKVADETSTNIEQMTEALKNTTELGTVMGAEFLDVATALGIMADHGIRASSAGTSLRTSMLQMIAPTKLAQKTMEKYFVSFSAIDPVTGKIKDLHTLISDLSDATRHLNQGDLTIVLERLSGNKSIKAIGALISAVREEEKQLKSADKAVENHGKTWSEARKIYGDAADGVSYLQKITEEMANSGGVQLKKLSADFNRLLIGSVNDKELVKTIKELRAVVTDPATKDSVTFIVNAMVKLASLTFEALNGTIAEIKNLKALKDGEISFGTYINADSSKAQIELNQEVASGAAQIAEEMSKAEEKVSHLKMRLKTRQDYDGTILDKKQIDEVRKSLVNAEAGLADLKSIYKDMLQNGGSLTESMGLGKEEINTAIGYAENRIKTLQKMVDTGKAPVGGYLDDEGLSNANKDLIEAKQHLVDLQNQLGSVGKEGSRGFQEVGEAAQETTGSVAADVQRMYEDINQKSGSYLAQWEADMEKAASEIQMKLMTPGSDKYEPPLAGEDGVAYAERLKEIVASWDEANRKMHESEMIQAKLKDLKPATDAMKQLAADTAEMEKVFAEQKAALESQALQNQEDYDKGLISHSQYWKERTRITEQALTNELAVRESAMREAQAAYDKYVTNFGYGQQDEELVGKQIELQKKLADAQREVAEIRGKILNTQKQSNAESEKEANTYAVSILQAQADLLILKGQIYAEDALIYEGTLKQLEADNLSLQYGDKKLNDIRLQINELKKLEAATKTPYEAMQKGMKEAVYSGREMADDIQRATENAFDSMTDAIVDFVKTGKMNFSDLTDAILTDLLTIMVRANVTNTILAAMGSVYGEGAYASSASELGSSASSSGLGGLFTSGGTVGQSLGGSLTSLGTSLSLAEDSVVFSTANFLNNLDTLGNAALAGVGSLALSALTGDLNTSSAFQAGGAAIGSLFGGGGSVVGGLLGSLVGGLFGDDKNYFGFDPKRIYAGSWDTDSNTLKSTYVEPTTTHWAGDIFKAYGEAVVEVQKGFNTQVSALATALPKEAADIMNNALATTNFSDILATASAGKWETGEAEEAINGAIEKYSKAMLQALASAVGAGVTGYLDSYGAAGLVGDDKVWGMLTDAVQRNIETTFRTAASAISGGDYEGGLSQITQVQSAVAAISDAMAPITEIVETAGLTDYALQIRNINNQFIEYEASLKAAGVDLVKYTDFYKAWDISVAKINAEEAERLAKEKTQLLATAASDVMSALEDTASAASNALGEAESALNSAYEAQMSNLDKVHEKTITNLEERLSLLTEEQSALSSLKSSLTSGINSLGYGDKATVPADLARAMETMYRAVEAAGAGDFSVARSDNVDTAISTLSSITTDGYSSIIDFQRDSLKAFAVMDSMRTLATDQINTDDRQIQLLEDQISAENTWYEAETLLLQKQLSAILGLNTSILSIGVATSQYQTASQAALVANSNVATGAGSAKFTDAQYYAQKYEKIKSAGGLGVVSEGVAIYTVEDLIKAFYNAGLTPETHYKLFGVAEGMTKPSFAVGTDYVPYDMTANIHQGERITPAAYNRSDATNAELLVELKSLREVVTELSYIASTSNDANIKTSKLLNRIEAIGVLVRSEA